MEIEVSKFKELQSKINYQFKDEGLLKKALTHRSIKEVDKTSDTNDRLEFLGDALIYFFATKYVLDHNPENDKNHPVKDTEWLHDERERFKTNAYLSEVGKELALKEHIIVGRSREEGIEDSMLADTVEAIVGSIYMESPTCSEEFVLQFIIRDSGSAEPAP